MVLNYRLFTLLLCFTFFSCNAERQAIKRLGKIHREHPQLFSSQIDTLVRERVINVPVPKVVYSDVLQSQTVMVSDNEKAKVVIERVYDTITNEVIKYKVLTTVKADTIYISATDTVIIERLDVTTSQKIVKRGGVKWFTIIGLVIFSVAGLMLLFYIVKMLRE
jgi:hypothetical protein